MAFTVPELVDILRLEPIEDTIFRGRSPQVGWQRVFGGLVIAQALVACCRTVPDRLPHSLHGYFMLPGDPSTPIIYEVDRLRDGRSFATRRCTAIQHGKPIFTLAASFHDDEAGLTHAMPMPDVPHPDALPSEPELLERFGAHLPEGVRRYLMRERPLELRPVDLRRFQPGVVAGALDPVQHIWMRITGPLGDDPILHRAALAYMSDMTLLDTALVAHGRSLYDPTLQVASLDHALWIHRPPKADEWLLYAQESPNASGARGMARGLIYAQDGALVASVAQEGLIRPRS
ncbi:acyl-CoA thioesterase II [Lichenihabitans sp. Uapishka_5]|uniref:acyl-CoA thioesterase II n=1 Tax=Lichenihabitans sp. Uapishka_5 TaxID=3037302 RepID=UPI0029E7CF8F|nr:acyl-CoA thioesterase II [Lichenihabitans sp. Uapishka_5]MDX7950429.1 acyl-CoA thioesterase II [Lichenihabitans sp. Uapishka_5]